MSNLQDAIKETVKDMIEAGDIEVKIEDGEIVLSIADQDSDESDDE
jgi:hypothetical protein|tara:strand:- start:15 stop:152 length:138 start_codon:yes stop_codon:yes gene_type:complete